MKIVEGKYYRNRSGKKVGPAEWHNTGSNHPWNIPWDMGGFGKGDYFHYEDGRSCLNIKDDDIVAEWGHYYVFSDTNETKEEETMEYKTWDQMTSEEKGSLLLARHEGKVIEYYSYLDYGWTVTHASLFCGGNKYRVKPEPKVETITLHGYAAGNSFSFGSGPQIRGDTHKITFDTIDGEPDCSSVRMEKITKDDDCPF